MTLKETIKLLRTLKDCGVNSFKSGDIEIAFANSSEAFEVPQSFSRNVPHGTIKVPETAAAAPPVEMKIPHHVNEVAALLKLSNNDLVDRMFPEAPEVVNGY